jgi:co-chaperonin GroES (HSP10)
MNLIEVAVTEETYEEKLSWFFPKVELPYVPFGGRVLVQMKRVPVKSRGGIQLTHDAIDTELWNTQVGILAAIGPLAFRNKDNLAPWSEGMWARVGDFVRTPKYGGDRVEVDLPGTEEKILFAAFNDHELLGLVKDPLKIRAFIA